MGAEQIIAANAIIARTCQNLVEKDPLSKAAHQEDAQILGLKLVVCV